MFNVFEDQSYVILKILMLKMLLIFIQDFPTSQQPEALIFLLEVYIFFYTILCFLPIFYVILAKDKRFKIFEYLLAPMLHKRVLRAMALNHYRVSVVRRKGYSSERNSIAEWSARSK